MVDDDITGPFADFADRLRSAVGDKPQAIIAKRADMSSSGFNQLLKGKSEPGAFKLARIARVVGVDLQWLATGEGAPNGAASGYADIPILDVRLAAGAASIADGAQQIGTMPMDMALLRSLGRTSSDGLTIVEAEGDSMEPIVADGARVLVDTRDSRLREGIFAFRLGDELRIKRLRRRGVDSVEVLSENARYEPELLAGEQLEHFAILGRALWAATPL